jgi:hypothetical protein
VNIPSSRGTEGEYSSSSCEGKSEKVREKGGKYERKRKKGKYKIN